WVGRVPRPIQCPLQRDPVGAGDLRSPPALFAPPPRGSPSGPTRRAAGADRAGTAGLPCRCHRSAGPGLRPRPVGRGAGRRRRAEASGTARRVSGRGPPPRSETRAPRPTSVTVSVVVGTHNHAESLRHTLQSLKQLSMPEGMACELIVVDNASSDETAEVVRA